MNLRRTLVPALIVGAMLVSAAPAAATYDPISSGTTRITFSKEFIGLLKRHGVKLIARSPVTVKGKTVTFPVAGGKLDPVAVRGTVDHAGSLVFQAGRHSLPLKSLTLKTTQVRSPLSAKFGGGQLKLAATAKLTTKRQGFGLAAKVGAIKLSAKLATRLDKKLGLRGLFSAGQPLGSSLTNAQPATVAVLPSGRAALLPAPAFLAKLKELFVSLNPIAPAELAQGPVFTFPIAGGALAPDASAGTLETAGTLEFLQLGGGQIFWHESGFDLGADLASAEVDFEPSPPYPGKQGLQATLGLSPGAVSSEPGERKITVANALLTLQPATAAAFNEAFARPQGRENVFSAGEVLGSVSFTAQGQ